MTEERQRIERTEEERQQRRRRHDGTLDAKVNKRLAIPKEIEARLKAEGLSPRWVNDEGSRIHDLTVGDDYEKVDGVEPVPVVVDKKNGTTVLAHLYAKRIDHIAEDRAAADKTRREMEAGMMKGQVPTGAGETAPAQGQMGATVYAHSANSIGRENRIIE